MLRGTPREMRWGTARERYELHRGDGIEWFSHEARVLYDNFIELFINNNP